MPKSPWICSSKSFDTMSDSMFSWYLFLFSADIASWAYALTLNILLDIPFTTMSINLGTIGTGVQSRFICDKSPSTAISFLYLPTDCSALAYRRSLWY